MDSSQPAEPDTLQFDSMVLDQEPVSEIPAANDQVEEISFEGLEELFGDDEQGR